LLASVVASSNGIVVAAAADVAVAVALVADVAAVALQFVSSKLRRFDLWEPQLLLAACGDLFAAPVAASDYDIDPWTDGDLYMYIFLPPLLPANG